MHSGKSNPLCMLHNAVKEIIGIVRWDDPPPAPPAPGAGDPPAPPANPAPAPGAGDFKWKEKLSADVRNSPLFQGYDDNAEGFNKAATGYANLEKLLGHEKVPIPKDDKDVEGWNRLSKALGVPDKAEAYGLMDPELPADLKSISFDKQKFAETVHAFKLTPNQAKGLWGAYTDMMKDMYSKAVKASQENMTNVINQMRGEFGDAYDTKVELGQMVINKFGGDDETINFLTTALVKDPRGIKFLAKLGEQFSESKIGEFAYKRFSLTPEEAQKEIDTIIADPKHPYNNEKSPQGERNRAIDYVNSLYAAIQKSKG